MKKYILFALGLLVSSAVGISIINFRSRPMDTNLRIAFPYNKAAKAYEPTRIHLAPEYIFLENTFSPLFELSPTDGKVEPGVAESSHWRDNELFIKIRKGLKTIDGYEITPKDVEFSLKRLLVKTGNTHGNFKDLVCGSVSVKSVNDQCEGIRIQDDYVVLKVAGKSAFIIPMLSAIDFAIVPKKSVDPENLNITDYRNTTGLYYVERDSETGDIVLAANPEHYHYSKSVPQRVILVPVDPSNKEDSLNRFRREEIDLITTIDSARPESIIELSRELPNSTLHVTMNIRSLILVFTERGITELTPIQRFSIGKLIRQAVVDKFGSLPGYERSHQFFPSFGDGALSDNEITDIESKYNEVEDIKDLALSMTTVRVGDIAKFKEAIQKTLPNVAIEEGVTAPAFEKHSTIKTMPHMYIGGPDTGFNEDISLISYSLAAGFFGMNPKERESWLANYMSKSNKEDRMQLLRGVHAKALGAPIFIPLLVCPYTALAQNSWQPHLSQLYANNQLWLIQKD